MTNISRRSLVAALSAAVPVATGSAFALATISTADPIFAAIERHRRAYDAHGEACIAYGAAENGLNEREAEDRMNAAGDAALEAWRHLFEVKPATMAGLIAVVRYAAEPLDSWGNRADSHTGIDDQPDILAFVAESLERLARA